MEEKKLYERYQRQIILKEFGEAGQQKLTNASVLMIGVGGLGCPALLYLAAAGVGRIGIVDGDTIDISNLQRQVLYRTDDEGKLKAEVAARELQALNPEVLIDVHAEWLTKENVLSIVEEYDLVIDGSDNFATRYMVNDACVILGKVLVYGSVFKFEGQVSVFNYQDGPTYRCLFPEAPEEGTVPNCSEIGVLGVLPGLIGTLQATEAIKVLAGLEGVLSGELLTVDALSMQFQKLKFKAVPENKNIDELGDYEIVCGTYPTLTPTGLAHWKKQSVAFKLIDVREQHEYNAKHLDAEHYPLSTLPSIFSSLPFDATLLVHCQSGVRSKKASAFLYSKGYKNVYCFTGSFGELEKVL